MVQLPNHIPVMVLPEATLFPGATYPMKVSQASHVKLVKDALEMNRFFILANEDTPESIPCPISGLGLIRAAIKVKGSYHLILQGLARIYLEKRISAYPYDTYEISPLVESSGNAKVQESLAEQLKEKVVYVIKNMDVKTFGIVAKVSTTAQFKKKLANPLEDFLTYLKSVQQPGVLADLVASTFIVPGKDRQALLDACSVSDRLRRAIKIFGKTYGLAD